MTRPLVLLVLMLVGCPPPEPPRPPMPPSGCAAACERLRQLGCELGRPTKKGATCEQVCTSTEQNGVNFNTGCLSSASTCAQADEC